MQIESEYHDQKRRAQPTNLAKLIDDHRTLSQAILNSKHYLSTLQATRGPFLGSRTRIPSSFGIVQGRGVLSIMSGAFPRQPLTLRSD
jgi:hypothetical protein